MIFAVHKTGTKEARCRTKRFLIFNLILFKKQKSDFLTSVNLRKNLSKTNHVREYETGENEGMH